MPQLRRSNVSESWLAHPQDLAWEQSHQPRKPVPHVLGWRAKDTDAILPDVLRLQEC
jgi:hypothetical protein